MEIVRSLSKDGNYNTSLYSLLKNMNGVPVFNNDHGLRNPLGIYNVAFSKVLVNSNEALDLIIGNNKTAKIKYKDFLESVNEFIDDSYNIIKCYYPKSASTSSTKFADKWLESVNKDGIQNYKAIINSYAENTKYIVNKIKHEHGRLEQIYIKTMFGTCSGYFLEKYINGVLGPDENVHKKYKKHSTAFSYFTDIMRNLAIVYIVSEKASEYLQKFILPNDFLPATIVTENNDSIFNLITKIWELPSILFPDEYQQAFTIIDIDGAKQELIIKYPAPICYINKFIKYNHFTLELLTGGYGTSESFSVPYMGI